MKYTALLLLVLLAFGANAQDLYQIGPNWKKGDQRVVETTTYLYLQLEADVVIDARTKSSYEIKVTDVDEEQLMLAVRTVDPLVMDELQESDNEQMKLMMKALTGLGKAYQEMDFIFSLDRETAQVIEIINMDELKVEFAEMLEEFFIAFFADADLPQEARESFKSGIAAFLDEHSKELVQTFENYLNISFEPHTYTFPLNDEIDLEIETYNPNAFADNADKTTDAIMHLKATEAGNRMMFHTELEYDNAELLRDLKNSSEYFRKVRLDTFELTDTEKIIINWDTHWVEKYESYFQIETPYMTLISEEKTEFKTIR